MIGVQGQCVVCQAIDNMPWGTIGLAAKCAVTVADRERTLLPLTHFALNRWCNFRRLAIASDVLCLRNAANLLAPFMRGEARRFHDYEIQQAKTWLALRPRANALAYASRSTSR
jgi:hypothetical protein